MKKLSYSLLLLTLTINISLGQLAFDRTRIILDLDDSSSQSLTVQNTSPNMPYLAQTWIQDEDGNKITSPLVALPILQRINPHQEKQVKISIAGNSNELPKDRESLLFFNALGVPPQIGSNSQVNVVIQSQLKLFYRPKGLKKFSNNDWVKELSVKKISDSIVLSNPTPYHIVIYGFSNKNNKIVEKDIILKPFSSENININIGDKPTIHYIDDYGSGKYLDYNCSSSPCTLIKASK